MPHEQQHNVSPQRASGPRQLVPWRKWENHNESWADTHKGWSHAEERSSWGTISQAKQTAKLLKRAIEHARTAGFSAFDLKVGSEEGKAAEKQIRNLVVDFGPIQRELINAAGKDETKYHVYCIRISRFIAEEQKRSAEARDAHTDHEHHLRKKRNQHIREQQQLQRLERRKTQRSMQSSQDLTISVKDEDVNSKIDERIQDLQSTLTDREGQMMLKHKEVRYLPTSTGRMRVLIHEGGNYYRIAKPQAQTRSPGLCYRMSKDLNDRDPKHRFAQWGTRVLGEDVGEGWVKVYVEVAHQQPWNTRHGRILVNDGLQPGLRSYFDRHLEAEDGTKTREPLDMAVWSLPKGVHDEKKEWRKRRPSEAQKAAIALNWDSRHQLTWDPPLHRNFYPLDRGDFDWGPAPSRYSQSFSEEQLSRDFDARLPEEEQLDRAEALLEGEVGLPASRPGSQGSGPSGSSAFTDERRLFGKQFGNVVAGQPESDIAGEALFWPKPWTEPIHSSEVGAKPSGWDSRHHMLWSNETVLGRDRPKLCVGTRSYFDRWRDPGPGCSRSECAAELKQSRKALELAWKLPVGNHARGASSKMSSWPSAASLP